MFATLGNWYVRGYCRLAGAERVFRIDRIREVELADELFTNVPESTEPEIGYTPGAEDVRATILLREESRWVADYFPVEIVADDPEGLLVRFSASDPLVIARLLLRLGRSGSLVEGEAVEETLLDLRDRVLARYRDQG